MEVSGWESESRTLRDFLARIKAKGGWGNEAIEIGLWHANQQHALDPITQVILIGDAPPNTRKRVQSKRRKRTEKYWKYTPFATPTSTDEELLKLVKYEVPVHAFYVNERARESFEMMAAKTNGSCRSLDVSSQNGADNLTHCITEQILMSIGDAKLGMKLKNDYHSTFVNV